MKRYTIEVNQSQLAVIEFACEMIARLGIGQWQSVLQETLPLDVEDWEDYHCDIHGITKIMAKHLPRNVNGYNSSLGITNEETSECAKIAWDLYQVFRHKRSWESAVENGYVDSEDSERNWSKMLGVNYDDPMKVSEQEFAKIKADETPL